jgi:hypothetical protein
MNLDDWRESGNYFDYKGLKFFIALIDRRRSLLSARFSDFLVRLS